MTNCPVCDASPMRFAYATGGIRHPGIFQLFVCGACGYGAIEPEPDAAALARVYDERFYATPQQDVPLDDAGHLRADAGRSPVYRNAERRVALVRRWRSRGRLLDVGCGKGMFVKAAETSYASEGLDVSLSAVEWGLRRGLRLRHGDLASAQLPAHEFEVVTMWDSLGCMSRPRVAFAKVAELLAPSGLLVLTTPDRQSLASTLLGKYWPMMVPPITLGCHTRRSLEALGRMAGFRLVTFGHFGKWIDAGFAIDKLRRQIGLAVPEASWLDGRRSRRRLNIYLNLWDIATATFEKIE